MPISFAKRMNNMNKSEIREILKLTQRPEIISFAGGLPAPELFPVEQIKQITQDLLTNYGHQVLQYSTTEGFLPFREQIAKRMNEKFKTNVTGEDITILSGSQQALDFAGKVFINEGDTIIVESPTYLGAINAFKPYGPKYVEIPMDEDGLIVSELEKALEKNPNAKFLYTIPDFQNPTGRTLSLERRKQLIEVINKYNLPVIEDNPYGELRFQGEHLPSLKSMDTKGLVIYHGTFSKTFTPGLRLGWVCASKEILDQFIIVKQSSDLHTSEFNQRIAYEYVEKYDLEEHIRAICALYKKRREAMVKAMQEHFPKQVKFTLPDGGLFLWITMPEDVDCVKLLEKAVEQKVAFVPGMSFYPNSGKKNTMRLNFSNTPEDRIIEGIKSLAQVVQKEI